MAGKTIEKTKNRSQKLKTKLSSFDEKILVIPDVHYDFKRVECILKKESDCRQVVFLGDFFDYWDDDAEDTRKCCFSLQEMWYGLENEDRKCYNLWGNHDLSYAWGNMNHKAICSGWTREKSLAANRWMIPEDWDRFEWFIQVDEDILLTHAGLSGYFVDDEFSNEEVFEYLGEESRWAEQSLIRGNGHWFYEIDYGIYGGILWNRPNAIPFVFNKIDGLRQIFGHTYQKNDPWIEDENYCIDTGLKHYVVIENGKIKIKRL